MKKHKIINISFFVILSIIYICSSYIIEDKNVLSVLMEIAFTAIAILLINSFFDKTHDKYSDDNYTKYLIVFIINLVLFDSIGYFAEQYIEFNDNRIILLIQCILVAIFLLTAYIFKIRLDVKACNMKTIIVTCIIGAMFVYETIYESTIIMEPKLIDTSLYFIRLMFFPAFYEEVIYRSALFKGLKRFISDEHIINIIQAIIFGVGHFTHYANFGIWGILLTSSQILMGYLFGILYMKSRSLIPSIIIHALSDLTF